MKKHNLIYILLLAPIVLLAQTDQSALDGIDLSDVVVIEDTPAPGVEASPAPVDGPVVVEIPDAPIDGAMIDDEAPDIPDVTVALPGETEVVLELPGQETSPGEATMAEEETISVDFPDEDIRTILRNVADLFDLNLVIPDTLQGRTSVKLRNITWRQVFEVVLEPLGFTYVEDRNIIRIKSIEELTTEPVDTRVFVANYARAEELKGSIEPLVDAAAGGRIQVDVRSNALVITERPSRMNNIQEIIESLDRPNQQVMIESKFIEVAQGDFRDLGVDWAYINDNPGDLVSGGVTNGTPFLFEEIPAIITKTVTDPTTGQSTTEQTVGSTLANVVQDPLNGKGLLAVFSGSEYAAVISALDEKNDTELVSNPTVVVMNNQKAEFEVGVDYPIREVTFNSETGRTESGEVTKEFIGIDLEVTPSVNAAGMISLNVDAMLSQLGGAGFPNFVESIGGLDPIVSRRQATTEVTIKDGFTIALGGLTTSDTKNSDSGIPILMDLPMLGKLFKTEDKDFTKTNLIVFITAKTLNPDGTSYEEIIDPRQLREMEVLDSDVPGYELPSVDAEQFRALRELRQDLDEEELRTEVNSDIDTIEAEEVAKEAAEVRRAEGEAKRAAYSEMQNANARSRTRL
jgi:type IV pilus assembly protein PilQ